MGQLMQTCRVCYSSSLNLNSCPENRFISCGLLVLVQVWVTTDEATVGFCSVAVCQSAAPRYPSVEKENIQAVHIHLEVPIGYK